MTQEDKELLLKDLCARLPYGIQVLADLDKEFDDGIVGVLVRIESYVGKRYPELKGQYLLYQQGCLTPLVVDEVKPYLRPMSSMTEEEINEFILISDTVLWLGDKKSTCILSLEQKDWLNAHHFDYRGLIEKGLAIKVTEENNPYE